MLINVSVSYIHQGFVNDPWFGQVEIRVQNFWALTYRNKCNDYSMPKSYIIMQLNGREGANLWSTSITNYGHNHAIKKRRCNVRKLLELGAWTEARGEAFKWDGKWSKGAERAVKGRAGEECGGHSSEYYWFLFLFLSLSLSSMHQNLRVGTKILSFLLGRVVVVVAYMFFYQ